MGCGDSKHSSAAGNPQKAKQGMGALKKAGGGKSLDLRGVLAQMEQQGARRVHAITDNYTRMPSITTHFQCPLACR